MLGLGRSILLLSSILLGVLHVKPLWGQGSETVGPESFNPVADNHRFRTFRRCLDEFED